LQPLRFRLYLTPNQNDDYAIGYPKHNKDKKRVKEVIAFVKESGGLEYTTIQMNDYKNKAIAILENYPESKYKNSLLKMIEYVVERKI